MAEDRRHGGRTEKQGFLSAAQMEDAVSEDMTALEISGELHLVDGRKGRLRFARHGLDRADREARTRRRDLLLTGHKRNIGDTHPLCHTGIDLTRQQSQRQANDARAVRDHALDGEMGFPGIGRSQHRGHAAAAQDHGLDGHVDLVPGLADLASLVLRDMPAWSVKCKGEGDFGWPADGVSDCIPQVSEQRGNESETNR